MEFESIIDSIINKIDSLNNVNANNYDNKNDNAIKKKIKIDIRDAISVKNLNVDLIILITKEI